MYLSLADTLGMEGEYNGTPLERKPTWLDVEPAFGRSPSPEKVAKKKAFTKLVY